MNDDAAMTAVEIVLASLTKWRQLRQSKRSLGRRTPPLFVGLQGPQGSGKSYTAARVRETLIHGPHNFNVAVVSLDDLYLSHADLTALREANVSNRMLHGRGLPGTHDLALGSSILAQLRAINDTEEATVELPVYDKSKFHGQGDRSTETVSARGPLDVVLFEGWMLLFKSANAAELATAYAQKVVPDRQARIKSAPMGKDMLRGPFFLQHALDHLLAVNSHLREYETRLWPYIDCFIKLEPEDMGFVFEWRLQQEHDMKARNGGIGMSDEQVEDFVARYMPLYEIVGHNLALPNSELESFKIRLSRHRKVLSVEQL